MYAKLKLSIFLIIMILNAKASKIDKIEPSNWWTGMQWNNVQVLLKGNNIAQNQITILPYNGVKLIRINKADSPNYLFLDIEITESAKPGIIQINIGDEQFNWPLYQRDKNSAQRIGFDCSDVVYLLFPDRFCNGDPENDFITALGETTDRTDLYKRHGGDILGIINKLDYLSDLGITTLWINPLLENRQSAFSYHGYAITDFYKIDQRFGTNELYVELVEKATAKNIKVIKDMVFNHCGNNHWWMNDLPFDDWINQWPKYTQSNYRGIATIDRNASQYDKKQMSDGWFDVSMPDLNQRNPYLAKYLIQNSIWWIEYAKLSGVRMDTYPYADKDFMSQWAKAILNEYPNFNVVGETWLNYPAWVAYWQKDAPNIDGYNSHLPTVMDFPLMYAIGKAFDEEAGWDHGLSRLYEVLAHDFCYQNPDNLLVFADNHDVSRFNREQDTALGRYKMAMAFLLTTRGIPQIYYGTEILMTGIEENMQHGKLRQDFLGGWPEDKRDAFTAKGRSKVENQAWNYLQNILKWRKNSEAIRKGKFTHFIPDDNCYVYFRHTENNIVMVIINSKYVPRKLKTEKFAEFIHGHTLGIDIITGKTVELNKNIQVSPRSAMIIELK